MIKEAVGSVSPELKKLASEVRRLIYNQYYLAVAAHPSSHLSILDNLKYKNTFVEMQKPRPGDLVAEISTIFMPHKDFQAVGYFIKTVDEKLYPDAEDQRDRDTTDKFTYIKCLDGTEQRWENCNFVKGFLQRI